MISIRFTCNECGIKDKLLRVPERKSPDSDVKFYIEQVIGGAIGHAHHELSPKCKAKTMTNLKIPFDDKDPDAWIGKQIDTVPPRDPV